MKGKEFKVNLTEKVGENTWYRGTYNNKTLWIHSSHLANKYTTSESSTSKLGKLNSNSMKLYSEPGYQSAAKATGTTNAGQVFYIKKQAKTMKGETYYQIHNSLSSSKGIKGWVDSKDVKTYTHKSVDSIKKTATFKGKGVAYNRAWGGINNRVFNSLTSYKGQTFNIHLTEKVVNNTWYRGDFKGKRIWVHSSHLNTVKQVGATKKVTSSSTSYNMTLNQFVNMQMKVNPQTDKGGKGWRTATKSEVLYYLNPANFLGSLKDKLQFADLSQSSNVSASEVNQKILAGNGVLAGESSSFINASKTYGVNEIYLISHEKLETGNGTSTLATGVKYNGKTVYNVYGIGAVDSNPINGGAKFAYDQGWTTVDKAIVGGAKF